jgi:formate dehydrogenase subunit gamma
MSVTTPASSPAKKGVSMLRTLPRFTLVQRWEHVVLLVCIAVLLLTGLPQKYRTAAWSQQILSTPERVFTIQNIHHIAAVVLTLLMVYHLGAAIYLLARRRLSGEMLPTLQDVRDAFQMGKYLLFLTNRKPRFGKYNFEQKFTYWFLAFALLIMGFSGFILWFPLAFTRIFPGGIIPAAKLAHSTEAVVTGVFIVIWHFYHVHLERLNLSIFTGWLNEEDAREYHPLEYERQTGVPADSRPTESRQTGGDQ